jgi:hypothetical protein
VTGARAQSSCRRLPITGSAHKAGKWASPITCRNRHCPKCQGATAKHWLAAREADLLPVPYYHVVFTLPAPIGDIAYQNKAVVYDLLFKVSAETLTTIAADPKHLGARVGITSVLHSWGSATKADSCAAANVIYSIKVVILYPRPRRQLCGFSDKRTSARCFYALAKLPQDISICPASGSVTSHGETARVCSRCPRAQCCP